MMHVPVRTSDKVVDACSDVQGSKAHGQYNTDEQNSEARTSLDQFDDTCPVTLPNDVKQSQTSEYPPRIPQ